MASTDTIVAISSPPGRSARGLIRWSGPEAAALLSRITVLTRPPPPRQATPTRIAHADLPALPAIVTWFAGPQSYTVQDTAEVQLPGHPALLDRVIRTLIRAGARPAEAGEFTFRAYTAGRLDLTEAEGVAATIHAVSDGQLAAAAHLRQGELARFSRARVDRLGHLLALVEAGIDFVDQEDVVPIAPADLSAALGQEHAALGALLARSRSWGAVEALPRVVLVGPPSAGKSTLFNALLGRTRAVIDAAPGTTRDVLEEPLRLCPSAEDDSPDADEMEVLLIDLAGLDEAESILDRDVQDLAEAALRRADLVLKVRPIGSAATAASPMLEGLTFPPSAVVLEVLTKCDHDSVNLSAEDHDEAIRISVHRGIGLDRLRQAMGKRLADRAVSVQAELLALQPRHEAALRSAVEHLEEASKHVDPQARQLDAIEWVAGEMRWALDELAGLGGELSPDDVIGRVFSSFCVGK